MKYNDVVDCLQNLTLSKISTSEIANILDVPVRTLYTRSYRNSEMSTGELKKLENFYNIQLISKSQNNNPDNITLDYYPDVFGSCGNGYFVESEYKEKIQVPVNALFKQLSKVKRYSVINAMGNSMQPYIFPNDKLIIEHIENEKIIDNHVYIFRLENELYIKRLYRNIDEIIAKSDNPDPIFKVKSIPKIEWNNLQIIGEVVGLMRDLR